MRQHKGIQIGVLALLCAGCGGTPVVVPEAEGVDNISAVFMGCNKPYELTQDCSGLSGARREVEVADVRFKIAGSADGTIVFVMDARPNANAFSGRNAEASNLAFEAAKRVLFEKDIEIQKVEPVATGALLIGYVLSTDEDAYAVLSEHTVED